MTKEKKILIYFISFILGLFTIMLVGIINVKALTVDYWGYDIDHFTNGWFRDCSASGVCDTSITTFEILGYSNNYDNIYPGFISADATTVADDAGITFVFTPNISFKTNSVYSAKLYMCNTDYSNSISNVLTTTGNTVSNVANNSYPITSYWQSVSSLSTKPYYYMGTDDAAYTEELPYCAILQRVFAPSYTSTMIGFQFTTNTTQTSNWIAVGYKIEYIGNTSSLTSSQVQDIVDNATSDVATISDIETMEETITNEINEMTSQQEITNDKLDETNQNLNDINGALTDDDVSSTVEDGGNFFNNFSTTDHGGLSGIITAPLVAINEMLNTSCSPMTATFKGKELSLPCGYEFWNKLGAIQDFINIVLGGLLCYRIIIKLYKLIERIKNPEDDRVEVLDL